MTPPVVTPLEAEARSPVSSTYRLRQGEVALGELRCAVLRRRATLALGAQTFTLCRIAGSGRPYVLALGETELARAYPRGLVRHRFELHVGSERLDFRRISIARSGFELVRGDEPLGTVVRRGFLRTRGVITLPPEWPVPVQVFLFFLARVVWQQEKAAS